jgi:diguanylate cyclase (GGDEF)-like protein/PAS domain S-box-containing protein
VTRNHEKAPDDPGRLTPEVEGEIFRLAVSHAPSPILIVDGTGTILVVNEAAERLFGYEREELLGESVDLLLPQGAREAHKGQREAFMGDPQERPMGAQRDLVATTKAGEIIPVEVGLSPMDTPAGPMVVCGIMDLSERQRAEKRLAELVELLDQRNQRLLHLVSTDELTSLKSRRAFLDHLEGQLEVAVRHARPLSVMILDIDHFKLYNDEFGHLAGDEVLRGMGETLQSVARRSDFVGRLGGEEFGVLLPETDAEGAKVLAERFRVAVEAREWPRRSITVSVGATTLDFPRSVPRPDAPGVPDILSRADRALYQSKELGRNRVTHADELEPDD